MSKSGWSHSRILTLAVLAASTAAVFTSPAFGKAHVLLVGTWHGHTGQFRSIQAAVDQARPGDWVLVGPGDYHERGDRESRYKPLAEIGAGVMITTPGIHLRGMDRNRVIVDGTKPGAPTCSRHRSDQDLGPAGEGGKPNGRNGVESWKVAGVSIENLTACNFLSGAGDGGNEIWINFGDGSGKVTPGAYRGAWLNATSTFYATGAPAGKYGIFASNTGGPDLLAHTYASNMNDASYYVGACRNCNTIVTDAHAQYSALGYSGTNSGGRLLIQNSQWDHNQAGIVTNSQNNDDAPSPQLGLCPRSTRLCTFFRRNWVHDNNNPNVPSAGSAELGPVGTGIIVSGGRFDTVSDNRVENNGAWGILLVPFPDSGTPPPISHCEGGVTNGPLPGCYYDDWGNRVLRNSMRNNGFFGNPTNGDLGDISGEHTPGNCWRGNRHPDGTPATSYPADLQATHARCGVTNHGSAAFDTLGVQVICANQLLGPCPSQPGQRYPRTTKVVMPPLPSGLRSMPNPCAGVPANAFCQRRVPRPVFTG